MKRILSFILAVAMLMTMAPAVFAQSSNDLELSTGETAYTAKVGETVSVPFYLEAATALQVFTGEFKVVPSSNDGLTVEFEAGELRSSDVALKTDGRAIPYFEELDVDGKVLLFTLKYTASKPGTYTIALNGVEMWSDDINDVEPYSVGTKGCTIKFEADASAGDPDFDKFKAKGVYYEATSDFENTGVGSGMHMNISGAPYIYSIGNAEGLAAFKADAQYATLGADIEEVIASKNAKYASYTDKDQAYNYVDYEGKHAMFSINGVATQFKTSTWKNYLSEPNMYWMIDADYFAPTDSAATFVIQYFDNKGAFDVRYSKQGGKNNVFTVKKGGTNTWVTKAFQVEDARLNKGLTGSELVDNDHSGRFECGSETYISKFAVLKTADYNDIMGIVPEEPDLPDDPAGEDACDFKKNSTYIGGEGFEYADKKDMEISSADIAGLTESYTDRTKGSNAYIVEDPANGLVLKVDHDKRISGTDQITNTVTKEINATANADYIIMSHKFMRSAGSYVRFFPNFVFKKYSDGSTKNGRGLSVISNGANLSQEGHSAVAGLNLNEVLTKWTEWDYVINAKELTVDLYIDHKYVTTMDCTNGSNILKPNKAEYYVAGVAKYEIYFDRVSGPGPFYLDDIQVRTMSKEQYAATFGADTVEVSGTSITTAEALPSKTSVYGIPVVWTTNNEDVTVGADGSITVKDATVTYEDVVFTASFAGQTKTFTLDVMKQSKYAEYIFGFDVDRAYKATSPNTTSTQAGNYYYQYTMSDGVVLRNPIVKYDEPITRYFVVDDPANTADTAASHEVSKEEYDAFTGKKQSYNITYESANPYTGDAQTNRYAQVGPEGDKRDAIFGVGHVRADGRIGRKYTQSMIGIDVGNTFTATDNNLVIEIDVLDIGTAPITIDYCNNASKIPSVNSAALTNTGEWTTVTINLTDANFAWTGNTGLIDNKADFRVKANAPTYVSAIRVYDVAKVELEDDDYTSVALNDFDVVINDGGSITAKEAITAEEAADAKLYVAYYNEAGNLVGVATSAQVTDGNAQTVTTGASVGGRYYPKFHTLKTFVWDADLKPLR